MYIQLTPKQIEKAIMFLESSTVKVAEIGILHNIMTALQNPVVIEKPARPNTPSRLLKQVKHDDLPKKDIKELYNDSLQKLQSNISKSIESHSLSEDDDEEFSDDDFVDEEENSLNEPLFERKTNITTHPPVHNTNSDSPSSDKKPKEYVLSTEELDSVGMFGVIDRRKKK